MTHPATPQAPLCAPAPSHPAGLTAQAPQPAPVAARGRRWRSADLFGTDQEVEIEHGQAVYRLRLTSLGKLILTK